MSQARRLSQKTDALVGGLRLAPLSDVPMEHVEAQLQRLGADGLDEFDPLIARVQKIGLESIERLDAQRDSEGSVRHPAAHSTPPEPEHTEGCCLSREN